MHCRNCGLKINLKNDFCPKCGTKLPNRNHIYMGMFFGCIIVFIISISIIIFQDSYYFSSDYKTQNNVESNPNTKSKYQTAIVWDNTYTGMRINNRSDAQKLIVNDSVSQKKNCPKEIQSIENEIISNYQITAVNFCEMDASLAKELSKVIKSIYINYPDTRGYMTNISIRNVSIKDDQIIASFMPTFEFATSKTASTYPWVYKTQILLNSQYFLNAERLSASAKSGSNTGHFPNNATMYSPVAHELGHYLSFVALLKHYDVDSILLVNRSNQRKLINVITDFNNGDFSKSILQEAYNRYKKDGHTNMSFDTWRSTISKYAISKDNNGSYIYDETIAEAFHDTYLNGNNAKPASKYIIIVLKEKLGK